MKNVFYKIILFVLAYTLSGCSNRFDNPFNDIKNSNFVHEKLYGDVEEVQSTVFNYNPLFHSIQKDSSRFIRLDESIEISRFTNDTLTSLQTISKTDEIEESLFLIDNDYPLKYKYYLNVENGSSGVYFKDNLSGKFDFTLSDSLMERNLYVEFEDVFTMSLKSNVDYNEFHLPVNIREQGIIKSDNEESNIQILQVSDYNNKNRLGSIKMFDENEQAFGIAEYSNYKIDSYGNWTSRDVQFNNSNETYVDSREITYNRGIISGVIIYLIESWRGTGIIFIILLFVFSGIFFFNFEESLSLIFLENNTLKIIKNRRLLKEAKNLIVDAEAEYYAADEKSKFAANMKRMQAKAAKTKLDDNYSRYPIEQHDEGYKIWRFWYGLLYSLVIIYLINNISYHSFLFELFYRDDFNIRSSSKLLFILTPISLIILGFRFQNLFNWIYSTVFVGFSTILIVAGFGSLIWHAILFVYNWIIA